MHRWAGGQGASGVQNFSGYYIQNQLYKIRVSKIYWVGIKLLVFINKFLTFLRGGGGRVFLQSRGIPSLSPSCPLMNA